MYYIISNRIVNQKKKRNHSLFWFECENKILSPKRMHCFLILFPLLANGFLIPIAGTGMHVERHIFVDHQHMVLKPLMEHPCRPFLWPKAHL